MYWKKYDIVISERKLLLLQLTLSSSMVHKMYHIIYLSYSMVVLYVYHNFRLRYRCSIEVQFLSQFVEGFQVLLPTNRSQKFVFLKNLSRSAIELLACVVESCLRATATYFPAKSLCLKELSRHKSVQYENQAFRIAYWCLPWFLDWKLNLPIFRLYVLAHYVWSTQAKVKWCYNCPLCIIPLD